MHELTVERQKNELLMKKLRETNKIVKSYELSQTPGKTFLDMIFENRRASTFPSIFSQQQEGAN